MKSFKEIGDAVQNGVLFRNFVHGFLFKISKDLLKTYGF